MFLLTQHTMFLAQKKNCLKVLAFFFLKNLALRQEDNTPYYHTWQQDRDFSLFHLSFDLLGTESERCRSFFLLERKEGGEEREAGGSRSYRVKHRQREDEWQWKEDRRARWEKTQRAPLLLSSSPPPLSVFTCTLVIKAILSHTIQLLSSLS